MVGLFLTGDKEVIYLVSGEYINWDMYTYNYKSYTEYDKGIMETDNDSTLIASKELCEW